MKSRKRLSTAIFLFWLGFVLGRSALYTSVHHYVDAVYIVADLGTIGTGILLGIDMFVSPKTSVLYRINLPGNANRDDVDNWYGLTKGGGVVFVIVNALFIVFVLWRIKDSLP